MSLQPRTNTKSREAWETRVDERFQRQVVRFRQAPAQGIHRGRGGGGITA